MSELTAEHADTQTGNYVDDVLPRGGYDLAPVVGLGGSAGSIPALTEFFQSAPTGSGLAFVVIIHLGPDHVSMLAELLQRATTMRVLQVNESVLVEPNTVYVIPPRKAIKTAEGRLHLSDLPSDHGKHVAVDLFFRTLADTHGPHAAAIVLSGADSDGTNGIKRIKERGGLTIAQDPDQAEHGAMPRSAIATGMVDWVLPVADMATRLTTYFELEKQLKLPSEDGPQEARAATPEEDDHEAALRAVLAFLRTRTGRDFSCYKRASIVRRIARRMQVNGTENLTDYLACLRTRPGEAGALLQDLLISVTNFFRDSECFDALRPHLEALFKDKGPSDAVRIWSVACATGEEAYSLAMLLSEQARQMDAPPLVQVFATDLDEQAIRAAREGVYPSTIEADVSEELLRRYFVKEHGGYRVRRELREMVLFAQHDILKDSPFSRLDLIACRNLLIYLTREAQLRVFQTFHFALHSQGVLFLGASESIEEAGSLFNVRDKKNRIFTQRPSPRLALPMLAAGGASSLAHFDLLRPAADVPVITSRVFELAAAQGRTHKPPDGRSTSWGELHFKMLETLAPPSILVDSEHDILHLSANAGRFLQYSGGEPSKNLLKAVQASLRIELRAALFQASQSRSSSEVQASPVEVGGETMQVTIRVFPVHEQGTDMFMVTLSARPVGHETAPQAAAPDRADADPVARHLDRELERLKTHLRDTVEQYEGSTEELKASNEELQAMNEELRSATEELETSREELQSINEELVTVNQELKSKVDELAHSNSDMQNLMDATAIATVFLDRELRIMRYTPSAVTLFNLIPGDVGRPLGDLATRLDYPQLSDDARRVLERLVPIEREVGLPDGNWFLTRLLPYRTMDDHIAGVVLSFIDITLRKRADDVRIWLSAVVASSSDAIISCSMDEIILSWNTGAEKIFGFSAAQAIGQPLAMLTPPDRRNEDAEAFAQLRQGQPVTNVETVRQRKDGTGVHVALSISPIKDVHGDLLGATAIARDITQARKAAEDLRRSEEQLRLVVENAREYAIFSMDLRRCVTVWNSGAQRLLGYTGDEVMGRPADLIFTEEDRRAGAPEAEARQALSEGMASDDRVHQRKDGNRFWASGSMMLMKDSGGRAVGFVKILRDRTAARESEQALEHSQADLLQALRDNERARNDLQAADAAKDRFLAVLSHELRNPLASIDSAAALLLTQSLPSQDRDAAAQVVKRQAGAMKTLLDDLLDVSRLKLGRIEMHRQKVLLSTIVETALETTRPLQQAAGHSLKVDLPSYPIELDADPLRLSQVLSNLLSNAIKYTPPRGEISLKARLNGKEVVITVADSGIGIEPSQIGGMFEMFAQAQPVAERGEGGLGIGLALVQSIVELHGGRVEAASAGVGKGSQFSVILPAVRASRSAPATLTPATLAPTKVVHANDAKSTSAKRGLILIADDNVDAAWGIARLLEIAGFETVQVRGGIDAVKETQSRKPDVAIVDIGMPDLGGHEVARQIRQTEWGKQMVLIAATGWGQQSDEREAIAAGFDVHMTKPVDLRKLSATVDELLQRKRR